MVSVERTSKVRCPSCGSGDLLTVQLEVGGEPASFTNCHDCENKWWAREGEVLSLREVIDLASKQ